MEVELEKIIHSDDLSDELKIALLPELMKQKSAQETSSTPFPRIIMNNGPIIAAVASIIAATLRGLFALNTGLNQAKAEAGLEPSQSCNSSATRRMWPMPSFWGMACCQSTKDCQCYVRKYQPFRSGHL